MASFEMNLKPEQQTRRAALVTFGSSAAGLCFSGPILEAATATKPAFPAGVYRSSPDHLGHALVSSSRFHSIPPGCPTDYVRPRTTPFFPLFFSQDEFVVIHRCVEMLLGQPSPPDNEDSSAQRVAEWIDLRVANAARIRSDARNLNPLHRALAVAYSGASSVNQLETANPEEVCSQGLVWLTQAAQNQRVDRFVSLPEQAQIALFRLISDERQDTKMENAGTRFFSLLKEETIRGYYTSQEGLKELDFKGNAFHTRSPGCNSKS